MNSNDVSKEETWKESVIEKRGAARVEKLWKEGEVIDLIVLPDLYDNNDDSAEGDGFILISDDEDSSGAKTSSKSDETNVSDKKIIENPDHNADEELESDEEFEIITTPCERVIFPNDYTHPIVVAEGEHILTVVEGEIYLPEDIFH